MEIAIAIISGGAAAAIVSGVIQIILWKMNRKATKEDSETKGEKATKNALRVLLYDRIKYLAKSYITKGSISVEDLEDLMNMHKIYHDDLDGNGFLDSLMGQVKSLPVHN